jgi:hypothetical protein
MKRFIFLAVFFLSACAGIEMDPRQCASAYDLGFRDAIMGLIPQDGIYDPACSRKGARLDLAAYRDGWLDGHFEYENRTPHTE